MPRGLTEGALVVVLLLCFLGVARLSAVRKAAPVGLPVTPLPGADLVLGRELLGLYNAHIEAAVRGDEKAYLANECGAYHGDLANYMRMDRESPYLHPEGFQIYDARVRGHDLGHGGQQARLVLVRPAADPRNNGVLCLGFVNRRTTSGETRWYRYSDASYSLQGPRPLDPDLNLPWSRLAGPATFRSP